MLSVIYLCHAFKKHNPYPKTTYNSILKSDKGGISGALHGEVERWSSQAPGSRSLRAQRHGAGEDGPRRGPGQGPRRSHPPAHHAEGEDSAGCTSCDRW